MDDEILIRFIKGQLHGKERSGVIKWIRKSGKNQKYYNMLVAKYSASQFHPGALNTLKSYDKVRAGTEALRRRRRWRTGGAVAAVLLLGVLLYGVVKWETPGIFDTGDEPRLVREVTPRGVSRTMTLPDGTVVLLNVDSELSYPKAFQDSLREVYLTGEAYFEVKRDEFRPFVVHTGDMDVRVLGTSFNVRSYNSDEEVLTTLITGSVEVENGVIDPVRLRPLQTASFDRKEKHLAIHSVTAEEAVSWKSGKLVFKGTPLKEVLEDLERRYDVDFQVSDNGLYDYLFTGIFDNLNIEEVLQVLHISSSINFEKKGGKIVLYRHRD